MERIEEYYPHALLQRFGDTVAAAGKQAVAAVEDVIGRLDALDPEMLDTPVAPGKWTALEVVDHLQRVTELYVHGLARVRRGQEPFRTEKGFIAEDGGLVVNLPEVEPGDGLTLEGVTVTLRRSTLRLIEAAAAAEAEGLKDAVVNMNPFFGELTPLGSVQMAALHARHHIRRHLARAS